MYCKIKCSHNGKSSVTQKKTLFLLVVSFYSPDQFTSHGFCFFFFISAHGFKIISVCTFITAAELYCIRLNHIHSNNIFQIEVMRLILQKPKLINCHGNCMIFIVSLFVETRKNNPHSPFFIFISIHFLSSLSHTC